MTHRALLVLAALLTGPRHAAAQAASYAITLVAPGERFAGCQALSVPAGIGVLASGDTLTLFVTARDVAVQPGDPVSGTWSVDDGPAVAFAGRAEGGQTLTLPVPDDADIVQALTTGRHLAIVSNRGAVRVDLAGLGQAFLDLARCMQTQRAP